MDPAFGGGFATFFFLELIGIFDVVDNDVQHELSTDMKLRNFCPNSAPSFHNMSACDDTKGDS